MSMSNVLKCTKFQLVRSLGNKVLLYDVNSSDVHRPFVRTEIYVNSGTVPAKFNWPPQLGLDYKSIVANHKAINSSGLPNFLGVRIPVKTKLKIANWRSLLSHYNDYTICDFLEFGFPVGYSSDSLPHPSGINHKGGLNYADHVDEFISKEVSLGAALGPFNSNPLFLPLQLSALNTVEKHDSMERRIILDLSFPEGSSVNAGIVKGEYLGKLWDLTYPTIGDFSAMIQAKGKNCLLYKRDLK
jgi:hypothetical protein